MAYLKLNLNLAEFEKTLIYEFISVFGGPPNDHYIKDQSIIMSVLGQWSWKYLAVDAFQPPSDYKRDNLSNRRIDRQSLWESALNRLRNSAKFSTDISFIRIEGLREHNPNLPDDISLEGESDDPEIDSSLEDESEDSEIYS